MGEISTKKTIDEQILERLQALEVLLMEQRKEIDSFKSFVIFRLDGVHIDNKTN